MSYLVLARKYRPQTFDQLIGQGHITDLLKKAIESNRLAHAFLFCGPRGIGKTSCARILAKSLNCEQGPTLFPCGQCAACREIAGGTSFDVIEIDGASNRGIDEIRSLRENVKFAPAYGRFKIYIVDEVHMLTTEAFNALLKTLEEPPPHVKFIFATTEANKVPSTILSRCQRFDFKRISVDTIMAALREVCSKENLKIHESALFAIAKASQGGMRDALSILDQLSALGDEGIDSKDVYSMLGIVETELLFQLTDALLLRDCASALQIFDDITQRGKDIKQLGKDLIEHYRHLMIVKVGGPALSHLVDYPAAIKQRLDEQTENTTIPMILKSIDILITAQETARIMESFRMPLEVAFAKLSFASAPASAPGAAAASMAAPSAPVAPVVPAATASKSSMASSFAPAPSKPSPPKPAASQARAPQPSAAAPAAPRPTTPHAMVSLEMVRQNWNALTHDVSRRKMSLASYLQDGTPHAVESGKLIIGFTKEHRFQMECLAEKDNMILIENVLLERLGAPLGVQVRMVDGVPVRKEEPMVKDVLEMFGGEVVKEWPNES